MVIPELRVADSDVRAVATGLGSAATSLQTVATSRPGAPSTGAANVSDAIALALAVHTARAAIAADAARAAAETARTSLDHLDAAERALVAALA